MRAWVLAAAVVAFGACGGDDDDGGTDNGPPRCDAVCPLDYTCRSVPGLDGDRCCEPVTETFDEFSCAVPAGNECFDSSECPDGDVCLEDAVTLEHFCATPCTDNSDCRGAERCEVSTLGAYCAVPPG